MAAKPPTAQGVSAVLRKAGHERSETHTTAVKGWHNHTEGYRVRNWGEGEGEVRVEHETSDFSPGVNAASRRDSKLAEYTEALEAKGWAVRRLETGTPCLLVTMKAEEG